GGGEALEDGGPRRALAGLAAQQLEAQAVEVLRHVGAARARRRRITLDLRPQDLEHAAVEGELAGERLVQHHAHGVPVARGPGRPGAGAAGTPLPPGRVGRPCRPGATGASGTPAPSPAPARRPARSRAAPPAPPRSPARSTA